MRFFKTSILMLLLFCLTACQAGQPPSVYLDTEAPVLTFTPVTHTKDGKPMYYLFDDNPEHLNSAYLADHPDAPSTIAHFADLTPGIYTVFSYHHRGYSVDLNADLYYDTVFTAEDGGAFQITALGLDHDWDWNQAWADYTNTPVYMPEFLRTYDCICAPDCTCKTDGGSCTNPACSCVIRDTYRYPRTKDFDHLHTERQLQSGNPVFLSEWITYIQKNDIHHFRYGGYDEPMWLMMQFEVLEGKLTLDTIAYQDKEKARVNMQTSAVRPGSFANEPQYKGIAPNAPLVDTQLSYTIGQTTPSAGLPVTIQNMRVPNGYTRTDGRFATNVNTWREEEPIAAESDLMRLTYPDDTKLTLYGRKAEDPDNLWRFDPYHTKAYQIQDKTMEKKYKEYKIPAGKAFIPNGEIKNIDYPTGMEPATDEFYRYAACNLGNFGVTYRYTIAIENQDTKPRTFIFDMKSIAGQVYRFRQLDENDRILRDDGGYYYMKKFDDNPAADPASASDPPKRLEPAEYSSDIHFPIASGTKNTIEIEVTTLTGCTAPMHNTLSVQ